MYPQCQNILGFPFHWASLFKVSQPHLSLSKLLTTLLPRLSTTDFFLISYSQLTHHHSDCFQTSGRSTAKERKIDFFCSWVAVVRWHFVPVTAGCAASCSEQPWMVVHADRGCWIAPTNPRVKTKFYRFQETKTVIFQSHNKGIRTDWWL